MNIQNSLIDSGAFALGSDAQDGKGIGTLLQV
jgi:hypothetical protein